MLKVTYLLIFPSYIGTTRKFEILYVAPMAVHSACPLASSAVEVLPGGFCLCGDTWKGLHVGASESGAGSLPWYKGLCTQGFISSVPFA